MSVVGPDVPEGAERVRLATPRGPLAAVVLDPAPGSPPSRGTVLLVPGFTGSKEDFSPLLPLLAAAGWRSVALDQRGQYESPGPDDPAAYAVEALGEDLLALAGALTGPVHLVGHSFGGLVSRAAVIAVPTAWASLTLMSSGPSALTGSRADALAAVRPMVETGPLEAVADLMDAVAAADPLRPPVPEDLRAFLRRRFLASSVAGLLAMADALTGEPDRVDALGATGIPVLVVHGDGDDAWLPATQQEMARRLGARHRVVPEARHSPAVEQPAATAEALLAFWDERDPAAPD